MRVLSIISILCIIGFANAEPPAESREHSFRYDPGIFDYDDVYHNCRLWAAISDSIPDSLIYNHLVGYQYSFKNISENSNQDGWGIACYREYFEDAEVYRGKVRAFADTGFDALVARLENDRPRIALAHIRRCSSGCCCHDGDSIPDPHPFTRFKIDRSWSFAHNGSVDKSILYDLIGDEYLRANPPTGSGIPECDPSDEAMIIDSELYFIYLLKYIEQYNSSIEEALALAVNELIDNGAYWGLNFVLSDGRTLWGFCRGAALYYTYDPSSGCVAVASQIPGGDTEDWHVLDDYDLLIALPNATPAVVYVKDWDDGEEPGLRPAVPALYGNFPNPFNSGTNIVFFIPMPDDVRLDIYDIRGRLVETVIDGFLPARRHTIPWDAADRPSGIYFYRLSFGESTFTGHMTLLK
jgi:hypothetical protein